MMHNKPMGMHLRTAPAPISPTKVPMKPGMATPPGSAAADVPQNRRQRRAAASKRRGRR